MIDLDPLHVDQADRDRINTVAIEIMDRHGALACVVLLLGCACAIGRYTGLDPSCVVGFFTRAWNHVDEVLPQ